MTTPSVRAITTPIAAPSSGWSFTQWPATTPITVEYTAQLAPASSVSGQNLRYENRVAPAVMLTATRPMGM